MYTYSMKVFINLQPKSISGKKYIRLSKLKIMFAANKTGQQKRNVCSVTSMVDTHNTDQILSVDFEFRSS